MKLLSAKDINMRIHGGLHKNTTIALTTAEMETALMKLGVKAAGKVGHVCLYEEAHVLPVLTKIKKPVVQKSVAVKAPVAPAADLSCAFDPTSLLIDLDHRLYTLIHAEFEEPLENIGKIVSGNQEIFKAIQQLQKYVTDRLDTVETSILVRLERIESGVNASATVGGGAVMYNPCNTPTPETNVVPIIAPKAQEKRKPHIGIIGVMSSQLPIIEREFGDIFKLSLLLPDERKRVAGLKNCDLVLLIRGKVSSTHTDSLRHAGYKGKTVEIAGGMDKVRDMLTNYYVEAAA